jgi:predicted nuclease of predicted toxin-antitoxin system
LTIWIDAQLSPDLAPWLMERFRIEARAIRDMHLRGAKDREIYEAARRAGAVVMTKDADFLALLEQFGPPPQVIWITCGNTSNARLRGILHETLPVVLKLLEQGEPLVEIGDSLRA